MKYILTIFFSLLMTLIPLTAQVGVNTENPKAELDVISPVNDPLKKPFRITNDNAQEIFTLDSLGNVGVLTTSPIARFDLRTILSNINALAIGNTNQTAAEAGAGALRYASMDSLQYSDGSIWITLGVSPPKMNIVANNASGLTLINGSTVLTNWTIVDAANDNNSFDPVTGLFTTPRDGVYSISITGACEFSSVDAGSVELIIRRPTDLFLKTVVTFLSNKTYPIGEKGRATLVNKGYIDLKAGDVVSIGIFQRVSNDVNLVADGTLNILNIVEM